MKTFKYSFIGRQRGAIGCTYRVSGEVEALGLDVAEIFIRDEYEIFHSFMLVEANQQILAAFESLPNSMIAYVPNHLANDGSPAKKAHDMGHIWVRGKRGNSYRHVFDSELNHLFSGSNDDLRTFYDCSPKIKFEV